MQHLEIEAPHELRDVIHDFWYAGINFDELPLGFEVAPDGYAEIAFLFGTECSVVTDNGLQPLPSPFMMGLLGRPAVLHGHGRLQVIGIRCYPWTVFHLLGLPAGGGGVRRFEHPIARLQPVLQRHINAGRIAEALAEVKQYFLLTYNGLATDAVLHKAGTAMRRANGTLPVSRVAAAAHATVRTLERRFKQAAGLTVKDVSGLMRFEQAHNHLWQHPNASLAALAHELGYTDQAHLSREFKRYTGTTPAAFARKVKNSQGTAAHDVVVFLQA